MHLTLGSLTNLLSRFGDALTSGRVKTRKESASWSRACMSDSRSERGAP